MGHTFEPLSGAVIGAAIEVHATLGPGYREQAYERALAIELALRDLRADLQREVAVSYKGSEVARHRLDLVVEDHLVVEIKAAEAIAPAHVGQTVAYLRALDLRVGLVLNFARPTLQIRRVVASPRNEGRPRV